MIRAGGITNSGSINADGEAGVDSALSSRGCGGGGAGGAIYLDVSGALDNSVGTVSAVGAAGGDCSSGYDGGDGSDGRIRIEYSSQSGLGTMNPAVGYCNGSSGPC